MFLKKAVGAADRSVARLQRSEMRRGQVVRSTTDVDTLVNAEIEFCAFSREAQELAIKGKT